MRRLVVILIVVLSWGQACWGITPQYETLPEPIQRFFDQQFKDAYQLIADLRHPKTGVYRDAYVMVGQGENPSSIAATGVGLIALTIAHREGWEDNVEVLVEQTLRAMGGLEPSFIPDRQSDTGFFRHWMSPVSGGRAWNSEYSTIDTALLVRGALFAANYFCDNPVIRELAWDLYASVDWERAIANPQTGALYMVIDEDGQGKAITRPFNEYVIVADLARLDPSNQVAQATWENVYHPELIWKFPQINFFGYRLLSDGSMLSSFVSQFVYYLVHDYTVSPSYQEFFRQAQQGDKYDWNRRANWPSYLWGHGAGTEDGLGSGYLANAIGRNKHGIVSPYIIAGFLPVYPEGIEDLYSIYLNHLPYDVYENESDQADTRRFRQAYRYGLVRFAPEKPRWYPAHMSLVDWSSMLYGLAAFKHGQAVFTDYTNSDPLLD